MKIMISQPMKGKTEEQIREEREELVKDHFLNQSIQIQN